ncbi:signal transduction histidine kinase [Bradyrhizobium sp. CIR18]|uniref:ATP-binding protein n=1 Tax=Bradyrhizobium sp. CIR18 TaxID=2663839 RepID=UPI0017D44E28|nr:ATP-binding protein [Bradyrhizobium sp. CIR18]MBB4366849.1 signal transduction histidine kinase [Bradyrhizobium sp. CIR18]
MTRSDRDMIVDKIQIQIQIQIQKVALDLMCNAIESMASCRRREAANLERFTVADKGPGISADIADRLFQPFVTIKRHGMGAGLCRTIIESHGGYIVAEANPGGSTILQFSAPFAELNEET